MITRFTVSTLLALLLTGLQGCGQKGPLTPPPTSPPAQLAPQAKEIPSSNESDEIDE